MKKAFVFILLGFILSLDVYSQTDSPTVVEKIKISDLIKVIPKIGPLIPPVYGYSPIEEVLIRSYKRAGKSATPGNETVTYEDLKLRNNGQDLPMLLQHQTGIVVTSDAGNGIGYTGIRVRGSDATRTNISVNGVPINDAESQGTFWVNMPDLASSAKNVHIQRGVGSSVHGAGAFGASVMIETGSSTRSNSEINLSYGSFNSRKITGKYSSGIKNIAGNNKLSFDIRLSNIGSDGFIDRASTRLFGYLTSVQLETAKGWRHKLMAFGGWEKTFQAWWGIPIEKYKLGDPNTRITQQDSQNLLNHYYRNIEMYRNKQDSANLFESNPNTYNYYNYPNETDNYTQHHLHYYLAKNLSTKWQFNSTAYYTFGQGYFEQFRFQDTLDYYGISPVINGGDTAITSNLIRRRWLRNHLLGLNLNLFYSPSVSNVFQFGFGGNQYMGEHFGLVPEFGQATNDVTRIAPFTSGSIPQELPKEYYRSTGNKTDISSFLKWNHTSNLIKGLRAFADLQWRYVKHTGLGNDNDLLDINFLGEFLFFNPKVGLNYGLKTNSSEQNFMASISIGNREPARSDFTDIPAYSSTLPQPERLIDYELGYNIKLRNFNINLTAYHMDYENQLVLTGAVNDVGTPLRQNVAKSYRRGIEISSAVQLYRQSHYKSLDHKHRILLQLNGAFSQNRIQQLNAKWVNYGINFDEYEIVDSIFENTPIAYSPDFVGSVGLIYTYQPSSTYSSKKRNLFELQILQKYVSQQFLDNTGDDLRSIPSYTLTEMNASYIHNWADHALRIGLNVQNVLNGYFANNGYTWGYMAGRKQLIQEVFVFPTAPRNLNVNISLSF